MLLFLSGVFKNFCRRYLQEHQNTPFSAVRDWLHVASKLVKASTRSYLLQWTTADTLHIGGFDITVSQLSKHFNNRLDILEDHVEKKLLKRISLEKLGIECRFDQDDGDLESIGHSLWPLPQDGEKATSDIFHIVNDDSEKFFEEMVKRGCLGYSASNLDGDQTLCLDYVADSHIALLDAFPLAHTTTGPPQRGTEAAFTQCSNTNASARHLCGRENLLASISNYHKGTLSTGTQKFVLRLFTRRLSRILFILLRIVRPIEVMIMKRWAGIKPERHDAMLEAYRHKLWVSWGVPWKSATLTHVLTTWFEKGLGLRIGLALWRHIALAMRNRYLKLDDDKNKLLREAAIAMAAHSKSVDEKHYAIQKGSNYSPSEEAAFIAIVKMWHELFGLSTF